MAFHTNNGLMFQRLDNGDIEVYLEEPKTLIKKYSVVIPMTVWASVVCSVSKQGENYRRWMEAQSFHNETDGERIGKIIMDMVKNQFRDDPKMV